MHLPPQELKGYLRKGISLDELWRVARGEVQYRDFASSQQNGAPDELVRHDGTPP